MGLGGRGIGDHKALADKVVREEAAGDNHRICSRETNIISLYRRIPGGGFH